LEGGVPPLLVIDFMAVTGPFFGALAAFQPENAYYKMIFYILYA
jgi:hypothetical protein